MKRVNCTGSFFHLLPSSNLYFFVKQHKSGNLFPLDMEYVPHDTEFIQCLIRMNITPTRLSRKAYTVLYSNDTLPAKQELGFTTRVQIMHRLGSNKYL